MRNYNEVLLSHVGEFGRYQLFLVLLLIPFSTFDGTKHFVQTIAGHRPPHRCFVPGCDEDEPSFNASWWNNETQSHMVDPSCSLAVYAATDQPVQWCLSNVTTENISMVPCNHWVYDRSYMDETLATEFDLICHQKGFVPALGSIHQVGLLFGSFVGGLISDRFGRLRTYIGAYLLACPMYFAQTFATNYYTYAVLRFFMIGIGYIGMMALYMLKMELVSNKYRPHVGFIQELEFVAANLLVGLVSYYVPTWRPMQRILSFFPMFTPLLFFIFPESVSWLLARGEIDKAVDEVTTAARWNKKHFPREEAQQVMTKLAEEIQNEAKENEKRNVRDLVTDPKARSTLFFMTCNWIAVVICWYGLFLNIEMLSGDFLTNFLLMSVADLPSAFLCFFLLHHVGRKWPLLGCQVLSGTMCVLSGFITSPSYMPNILCFIGKGISIIAFNMIYLYTTELFPTGVRTTAFGFCSGISRIAGIGAPFIAQLKVYGALLPPLVLGVPAIVAGLLVLFLPDTKDRGLPENLRQAEDAGDK